MGVLSIGDIIFNAFCGKINVNFMALMLPVGIGLLKGKESSRIWAIRWMWIMMFILCIASVLALIGNWQYFGKPMNVSWGFRIGASLVILVVAWVFYRFKRWFDANSITKNVANQTLNRTA